MNQNLSILLLHLWPN